jgi:DNA-binding response OmpR family regulator
MRNILLVEDDAVLRPLLEEHLRIAGYVTYRAATSREALRILAKQPIDVLLTDVELPDMSGLDLAAAIRRQHFTARIPVIFITSHRDEETRARARTLGGIYVPKPVTGRELTAAVRRCLLPAFERDVVGGSLAMQRSG